MNPIRVLLADDHVLMRSGLRSLLEKLGAQVVGEASDGLEALHMISEVYPEIVLMDIAMPGLNGLEAAAQIKQEFPSVRIIILSMYATAEYARRALRAGAAGYLLKDAGAAELELAFEAARRGEVYLSPRISRFIANDYITQTSPSISPLERLTSRQREILQLIAEGQSRKEIAKRLCISVKTFDTNRAQLMEALDIHDNASLVRFATNAGLLPPE